MHGRAKQEEKSRRELTEGQLENSERKNMTAIRQEAIELLEKIPEDKLSFVIQIMRGVNGLLGETDSKSKKVVDLDQFVMPATERGQKADSYVRELRDNDRI